MNTHKLVCVPTAPSTGTPLTPPPSCLACTYGLAADRRLCARKDTGTVTIQATVLYCRTAQADVLVTRAVRSEKAAAEVVGRGGGVGHRALGTGRASRLVLYSESKARTQASHGSLRVRHEFRINGEFLFSRPQAPIYTRPPTHGVIRRLGLQTSPRRT